MGRMKVYSGSWDLPETQMIGNPYAKYIVEEEPSHNIELKLTPEKLAPVIPEKLRTIDDEVAHTP